MNIDKNYVLNLVSIHNYVDNHKSQNGGFIIYDNNIDILIYEATNAIYRLNNLDFNKDNIYGYIYSYIIIPLICGYKLHKDIIDKYINIIKYNDIQELKSFINDLKSYL